MRTPTSQFDVFMKPFMASVAALFLLMVAGACGPSPDEIASEFVKAKIAKDAAKAHSLASPEDQVSKSVDMLKKEWESLSSDAVHQAFDAKTAFSVLETSKDGDRAAVKVKITAPDYEAMRKDTLLIAKAMSQAKDDKAKEEELLQKFIVEKFSEEGVPMKDEEQTLQLVRIEKKWSIVLGWKEELAKFQAEAKAKAEREARLQKYNILLDQARQLAKFGDHAGALKLLGEAGAEAPTQPEARQLTAQYQQEQTRKQAKKPYLDGLRIASVQTSEMDTAKGRATVIKGKVTNATAQSYRVVTLAVDILDATGKPVERELFNPWDMDTIGGGSQRALSPFSPSYVHDFLYTLKSRSQIGNGKVRVTVVDCILLNEQAAPGIPAHTGGSGYKSPAGGSMESLMNPKR